MRHKRKRKRKKIKVSKGIRKEEEGKGTSAGKESSKEEREIKKEGMTEETVRMHQHFHYMLTAVEDLFILGTEETCASLDEE